MLEGRIVNLKIMEKEDLPVLLEWDNNPEFLGEYEELRQETKAELEKTYDNLKDAFCPAIAFPQHERMPDFATICLCILDSDNSISYPPPNLPHTYTPNQVYSG